MHQNYIDSFMAIDDLARAASCFSDATVLAEAQQKRPWQTPLLPYVASLAGRGVVTHNRHPAPSRFLQTRKPQVFAIDRQAMERKRRARRAFLPVCSTAVSAVGGVGGVGGGSLTLVTDTLPFLRLMLTPTASVRRPLTSEQWDVLMELTAFAGRIPQPPAAAAIAPAPARLGPEVGARVAAGGASETEDDIEE